MKMIGAPLVYVGPTLSVEAVQSAYPGCIVRPPIRRGDLYRDRMLRGAVFLILDGVFFQDQAVSPREILDVIADGATVIGAASMGALRAAECWPAGMRGVGSIYRLFRSEALESDDEVAVAFSEGASSSVALINVRYAVREAERAGLVGRDEAERIVRAASEAFYADRHWPMILRAARVPDRLQLAAALATHDLKALDAKRALERVKRWLREEPSLLERPRATRKPFTPSEERRERDYDASVEVLTLSPTDLQRELARSVFASGRYLRHAAPLTATAALSRADTCEPALLRSFVADQAIWADILWRALRLQDELDAELFRFHAQRVAAARALADGTQPSPVDRHAAEQRIATSHGYPSWATLIDALEDCPEARTLITQYRHDATLARAAIRLEFARF